MGMILEDAVAIRKVATTFGAEVSGIPISGDIPAASLARFIDLLHENRMLLVPRIALEPADQVAFSRRLGPRVPRYFPRIPRYFVSATSSGTG
jgi:alpha-ketoglutarate-dependent taurine dioxygenase